MIGRTEDERDLLHVEGRRDVCGDDRLCVDERDGDEEETIDDSHECEEDVGGVGSLESEESARMAQHCMYAEGDFHFAARCNASTLDRRPGRHHYVERRRIVSKARGK
jgi:hypothetical protein